MTNDKDKVRFLKEATKALEAERKATDACRAHTKSCWVCRLAEQTVDPYTTPIEELRKLAFRIVSLFFRCRTLESLLFDHMAAKADADKYRPSATLHEGFVVARETETPSVDWLENLYRL